MKAARFLNGTDTYGRDVERAQSLSGAWFCRSRQFNGYSVAWSKWQQEEEPEDVFSWGWNKLKEFGCDELPCVRLPH